MSWEKKPNHDPHAVTSYPYHQEANDSRDSGTSRARNIRAVFKEDVLHLRGRGNRAKAKLGDSYQHNTAPGDPNDVSDVFHNGVFETRPNSWNIDIKHETRFAAVPGSTRALDSTYPSSYFRDSKKMAKQPEPCLRPDPFLASLHHPSLRQRREALSLIHSSKTKETRGVSSSLPLQNSPTRIPLRPLPVTLSSASAGLFGLPGGPSTSVSSHPNKNLSNKNLNSRVPAQTPRTPDIVRRLYTVKKMDKQRERKEGTIKPHDKDNGMLHSHSSGPNKQNGRDRDVDTTKNTIGNMRQRNTEKIETPGPSTKLVSATSIKSRLPRSDDFNRKTEKPGKGVTTDPIPPVVSPFDESENHLHCPHFRLKDPTKLCLFAKPTISKEDWASGINLTHLADSEGNSRPLRKATVSESKQSAPTSRELTSPLSSLSEATREVVFRYQAPREQQSSFTPSTEQVRRYKEQKEAITRSYRSLPPERLSIQQEQLQSEVGPSKKLLETTNGAIDTLESRQKAKTPASAYPNHGGVELSYQKWLQQFLATSSLHSTLLEQRDAKDGHGNEAYEAYAFPYAHPCSSLSGVDYAAVAYACEDARDVLQLCAQRLR